MAPSRSNRSPERTLPCRRGRSLATTSSLPTAPTRARQPALETGPSESSRPSHSESAARLLPDPGRSILAWRCFLGHAHPAQTWPARLVSLLRHPPHPSPPAASISFRVAHPVVESACRAPPAGRVDAPPHRVAERPRGGGGAADGGAGRCRGEDDGAGRWGPGGVGWGRLGRLRC